MCLSAGNFTGAAAGQDTMSALASDQCFNVAYELHKDEIYVGAIWLGAATLIGLFVGAVVAAIVFRLCCKKLWKQQDALLTVSIISIPVHVFECVLQNDGAPYSSSDAVHQPDGGCCLPLPRHPTPVKPYLPVDDEFYSFAINNCRPIDPSITADNRERRSSPTDAYRPPPSRSFPSRNVDTVRRRLSSNSINRSSAIPLWQTF